MLSRILIADTQALGLDVLGQRLATTGFTVAHLQPPLDPMAAFSAAPCDAIIVHLGYPNATCVGEQLRLSALGATVPLVYVGAGGEAVDSQAAAQAAGADAFWRLPLDVTAAYRRLILWVGRPAALEVDIGGSQTWYGPPPRAGWSRTAGLPRRFLRPPLPADGSLAAPTRITPIAPIVSRPSVRPPPAAGSRGPSGRQVGSAGSSGLAAAVQCAPWIDPEHATRERIRHTCAHMQVVDYYTLLELPTDAPFLLVDGALRQLGATYAPEAFSWALRYEARREIALIGQMLQEARWVLSDASRRASYTAHRRALGPRERRHCGPLAG